MKSAIFYLAVGTLALSGCPTSDPEDPRTGMPPRLPSELFLFDAESAPPYLDANLAQSSAPRAAFAVVDNWLVPALAGDSSTAGLDADLLAGVGFATYANVDYGTAAWADVGAFRSILTAEVLLINPGDSIRFCRSFATTCVSVTAEVGTGNIIASVDMAANLPDTEVGPIGLGLSAAIRETGPEGLTIAAPTGSRAVADVTVRTPFTLVWEVERGALAGTLDYKVTVGDMVVIEDSSGTALDRALRGMSDNDPMIVYWSESVAESSGTEVDYSYDYQGQSGNFADPFGVGVPLSPQSGLVPMPVYVYPNNDPGYGVLTLAEEAGPHLVQKGDRLLGSPVLAPGAGPVAGATIAPFDGDDFVDTDLEGDVDQGADAGQGFFPSPSLCYSQILLELENVTQAGVEREVHRRMFATIGNGVIAADASLEGLAAAINAIPDVEPVSYDRVGDFAGGELDGYIELATDYADSNVDQQIAVSAAGAYNVVLNSTVATTFRDQLNAILVTMEANDNAIRDALIDNPGVPFAFDDYVQLKALQAGLNLTPGSSDGVFDPDSGAPVLDNGLDICNGYQCNVAAVMRDLLTGSNFSGENPNPPGLPALASVCLWGQPPSAEVPAEAAQLNPLAPEDPDTNHPAYPAIPAGPATPPVRETISASLGDLFLGLHGGFIEQAFGPGVPASNFSLVIEVGDLTSSSRPAVRSIEITNE